MTPCVSAGGHELYLKPIEDYVTAGSDVRFATITEAALRRGEVAIGLRLASAARDPQRSFGVVVNPRKSVAVGVAAGDKVIVLADD